jgi:hypothetical protein
VQGEIESLARDRNADVRRASLDAVATLEQPGEYFGRAVIAALDDRNPSVRCAAAALAGQWKLHADDAIAPLISMLHSIDREEVFAAARSLRAFGAHARDAQKSLFQELHRAIVNCDYPLVDDIVSAIQAIADDPLAAATLLYRDEDSEKLQMAHEALRGKFTSES